VALATCPTHACHVCCDANFYIKKLLEGTYFKVNHIQLELLSIFNESHARSNEWHSVRVAVASASHLTNAMASVSVCFFQTAGFASDS
jgi:hypothetical protein